MKTTTEKVTLGFQRCSDGSVRALRMRGDELLSSRTVGDLATASSVIDSYLCEFPGGQVLIEDPVTFEAQVMTRGSQLFPLFDLKPQSLTAIARDWKAVNVPQIEVSQEGKAWAWSVILGGEYQGSGYCKTEADARNDARIFAKGVR